MRESSVVKGRISTASMPVAASSSQLFGERRDERLARLGADDASGMRVEGDGDGFDAERAGARDDLGDDPLMAAMHAVEVADGGDRWAEVRGDLCELAEDLHQAISNLICRPS